MSVLDLRPGLRAYLLGDAAIAAIVTDRVFHGQMPQGELRTSIVFNEISDGGDHHMEGPSGIARPRYQVDAWAPSIDGAAALARLIENRIDGFKGAWPYGSNSPQDSVTVQGVFFDTGRDLYEPSSKLYGKSRDYIIWFNKRP